jgi:HD superfamily phosphodiesterase
VSNHPQTDKRTEIQERLHRPQIVAAAADLAQDILGDDPNRSAHSEGVARRAHFLTLTVEPQYAPLLLAAAWLHDIGYAPDLRRPASTPSMALAICAPPAGHR